MSNYDYKASWEVDHEYNTVLCILNSIIFGYVIYNFMKAIAVLPAIMNFIIAASIGGILYYQLRYRLIGNILRVIISIIYGFILGLIPYLLIKESSIVLIIAGTIFTIAMICLHFDCWPNEIKRELSRKVIFVNPIKRIYYSHLQKKEKENLDNQSSKQDQQNSNTYSNNQNNSQEQQYYRTYNNYQNNNQSRYDNKSYNDYQSNSQSQREQTYTSRFDDGQMFFKDCTTLDELKKERNKLIKKFHSDNDEDEDMKKYAQQINIDYEKQKKRLEVR